MADTWGNRIKLTIFGESHGPAVGIVVDGLPPGVLVDTGHIAAEMARRAPGNSPLATARKEADQVEILSGVYNGKTTGSAVCGLIRSHNAHSGDYNDIPRPGHADLTAQHRYKGHADMRGGGHFSGRLTAPLVFAGALAKQALALHGITIHGRIKSIGPHADDSLLEGLPDWEKLCGNPFPAASDAAAQLMQQYILECKAAGDSAGGVIETAAFGLPPGLGDPFFNSIESVTAALFFSIPAVKGVEFGDGFALTAEKGSQANDPIGLVNGLAQPLANHSGGILGGISTGLPIIARLAVKPTPSIALPQQSVDPGAMRETTLEIKGRHDPCIVPRAVPVAEAALALAILDCMPEGGPQ